MPLIVLLITNSILHMSRDSFNSLMAQVEESVCSFCQAKLLTEWEYLYPIKLQRAFAQIIADI
jgi:hypothetical protein